ncbi:MAG: Tryptophanyl-tRNA synthetase [Planctomycetaceae bacterium]|nr:Tryptophanyl-tRNA synthetase [Planctomycetaceae bacterium]
MNEPQTPTTTPHSLRARPLVWCLGAVAGVALSAAICVNLPDRVKLLGLFPLIWGGGMGFGLRWWADEQKFPIRGWPTILASLLIAAGEVGLVLGGWILYREGLQRQFAKVPSMSVEDLVDSQLAAKSKPINDSESTKARRQMELELDAIVRERRIVQLQFSTFLYRRIQRLGDFSTPWPEVFWGCEIAFGTLAGVWCLKYGSLSRELPGDAPV